MARTALPPLSFGGHGCLCKLIPEHCFASTWNCSHMDLWSAWLVLTHHRTPASSLPGSHERERESKLTLIQAVTSPTTRFLGLSRSLLTWTSLPRDYHKNHLVWVDSSLVVFFELVLRLLASDNKDQPPLPDRLKKRLIWVDLIKVIPPWLCAICPLSD